MAPRAIPLDRRIKACVIVDAAGCWLWQRAVMPNGYGRICLRDYPNGPRYSSLAHRVAYETFVGPIPDGLEIDHLCRVKACVNPEHLEPVTKAENLRRRVIPDPPALCVRGHGAASRVTRMRNGSTQRVCIDCERTRRRERVLVDA